jgi:SAM-dependent methyltransferase
MNPISTIMSQPLAYRLWQAPFAERKFAPILAHNDLRRALRILDIGCGPGTNTRHFSGADYLGIDLNERYIRDAQRRHHCRFLVADATNFIPSAGDHFDFILVNSFLHHIDVPLARRLLSNLSSLLTDDGHVHILELVLPESASVARFLAHLDRGEFSRPLEEWRRMFADSFDSVIFEPYDLTAFGVPLWKMVYFKGRKKA